MNSRVDIWYADLTEELNLELLSLTEILAAKQFVHEALRRRFLVRRSVRRRLLAQCAGVAPNRVGFAAGPHGKPSLVVDGQPTGLHFSCSSSADLALVAVTRTGEIGVDMEQHRPLASWQRDVWGFFADSEKAALQALEAQAAVDAFFSCWTCKEAVLKTLGTGLSVPLHSFTVSVSARLPRVESCPDAWGKAAHWTLVPLGIQAGYAAALAARFLPDIQIHPA